MIVFPVVHILNHAQAEQQAELALSCGADGVFFIHHGMLGDAITLRLAQAFQAKHTNKVIGVNLLSMNAPDAVKAAFDAGVKNIWVDNAGIHSEKQDRETLLFLSGMAKTHGLYIYAGVAFKYQLHEPDPEMATEIAMKHNLLPVTSGSGTGVAADVDKIALMSSVAQGQLSVASGLTVENLAHYQSLVACAFVATGVSLNDYEFDEAKLRAFIDIAHQ